MPPDRHSESQASAPSPVERTSDDSRSNDRAIADSRIGQRLGGRYWVERRLGFGGSGTVYEAHDERRSDAVALKVLHRGGPQSVYRLKHEFRALRDVSHRNLVSLFELVAEGDDCFYTMELVRGVPFDQFVRNGGPTLHYARLAAALGQLVHGAQALHAAGRIHRDLKPSNVLVEPDGRVVIVDFGLVRWAEHGDEDTQTDAGFEGTPAYAAPEQYRGRASVTAAADWYAVGAMLHEVLFGVLPRRSKPDGAAQDGPPASPAAPPQGVPEALARVCLALLDPQPAARADGTALLEALSHTARRATSTAPARATVQVGRHAEMEALRHALSRVRKGKLAAVGVSASSGMGKSTLLDAFLEEAASRQDVLVLRGRCQIHENVPFKAFDAIIDALCSYLNRLPDVTAAALLPRGAEGMVRAFPAMRRVHALSALPRPRESARPDSWDDRDRALNAFKQLLAAIADHTLLCVCVDDLQWGDVDSARLLRLLLAEPDAPPMLFLGAFRSEDRQGSAVLRELFATTGSAAPLRVIELAPLDAGDIEALVRQHADGSERGLVDTVTAQAGGHPFYAVELARAAAASRNGSSDAAHVSLERVMADRVRALSEPARRVLVAASLAGASVPESLLSEVAEERGLEVFQELRAARMLREQERGGALLLSTYHDRVREVVEAGLQDDERRAVHQRLARLGEQSGALPPEQLVLHYRAAGFHDEARRLAVEAAARAGEAHAYFRAADMLRIALEHCPPAQQTGLRLRLARTLAISGQREAAGSEYDRIADGCDDPEDRFRMRVDAMRQWLLAGHPRGHSLLVELAEAEGLPMGRMNSLSAFWDVLRPLVSLRLPKDWDTAPTANLSAREQRQVTLCWAGMTALTLGDAQALRLSLTMAWRLATRYGNGLAPKLRVVMWLYMSSIWPLWWGRIGAATRARLDDLLSRAARRDEVDLGLIGNAMDAVLRLHAGQLDAAIQQAEPLLRYPVRTDLGTLWASAMRLTLPVAYFWTGHWRKHARGASAWLEWARERGDAFLERHLLVTGGVQYLVADQPERARRDYDYVVEVSGDTHPILSDPWWPMWTDLYTGDTEQALTRFRRARSRVPAWGTGDRALNHVNFHLWESACLARRELEGGPARRWRIRLKMWLFRFRGVPTTAAARLHLRAILACLRGRAASPRMLREAADAWDRLDHPMVAAALRTRLATYLQGDEAEKTYRQAVATFVAAGTRNPQRMIDVFASGVRPGPWQPPQAP